MKKPYDDREKQILENIKEMRTDRKIKQAVLAQKLGLCQNAYSKIELGRTSMRLEYMYGIAEILEVSIYDLILP